MVIKYSKFKGVSIATASKRVIQHICTRKRVSQWAMSMSLLEKDDYDNIMILPKNENLVDAWFDTWSCQKM